MTVSVTKSSVAYPLSFNSVSVIYSEGIEVKYWLWVWVAISPINLASISVLVISLFFWALDGAWAEVLWVYAEFQLDILVDVIPSNIVLLSWLCILAISVSNTNDLPSTLSTLFPIWFDTVVAKLGSSPNAVDNSFNVSKVSGAESTNSDTFVLT